MADTKHHDDPATRRHPASSPWLGCQGARHAPCNMNGQPSRLARSALAPPCSEPDLAHRKHCGVVVCVGFMEMPLLLLRAFVLLRDNCFTLCVRHYLLVSVFLVKAPLLYSISAASVTILASAVAKQIYNEYDEHNRSENNKISNI